MRFMMSWEKLLPAIGRYAMVWVALLAIPSNQAPGAVGHLVHISLDGLGA